MREIIFRAKSCVGNWVYGYLKKQMVGDKADVWAIQTEIPESEKPIFIPSTIKQKAHLTRLYENVVDPLTIGQFTGFLDKNGVKIFEGDIVGLGVHLLRVIWCEIKCSFELVDDQNYSSNIRAMLNFGYQNDVKSEVIGNIHDNPELLEVLVV